MVENLSSADAVHTGVSNAETVRASVRLQSFGTLRRYEVGEPIYRSTRPVTCWYQVLGGCARRFGMTCDGRRQIVEFVLPGDLFGFGDAERKHAFSAEAVASGTSVVSYPQTRLEQVLDADPRAARGVRELVFAAISRTQRRVVTLGRTSALERVGGFLLEMSERLGAGTSRAIILPMSRYDIADYLCIAVETVSRSLTDLRERGAIRFGDVRSVQICDRRALESRYDESQSVESSTAGSAGRPDAMPAPLH